MRTIPLTNSALVAWVDDEDYDRLSGYRWGLTKRGYVRRGAWNPRRRVAETIYMHREILGDAAPRFVDHRDGRPLNNTRANLRPCTDQQNAANSRRRSTSASPYKGLKWDRRARRWMVQIKVAGRDVYVGRFCDAQEAARAYDGAARATYGEYACVNFPAPGERSALTGEIVAAPSAPPERAA